MHIRIDLTLFDSNIKIKWKIIMDLEENILMAILGLSVVCILAQQLYFINLQILTAGCIHDAAIMQIAYYVGLHLLTVDNYALSCAFE